MLLSILRDDKLQTLPWSSELKGSFTPLAARRKVLYGSPMLDIALGQVDAVDKVLREFKQAVTSTESNEENSNKKKNSQSKSKSKKNSMDTTQCDNILPPELPTSWVQCELCKKWRRVPWHIDVESLSELWDCSENTWDLDSANCEAPQDSYDPVKENTLNYSSATLQNAKSIDSFKIGEWRDVFCMKNLVYYEGQIKKFKKPKNSATQQVLFHYKGWSSSFDEWIPFDSERIQTHNLFTNPDTKDPRQQEQWQGRSPVKTTVRTAFHINPPSAKKRPTEGIEQPSSASKRGKPSL